MKPKYKTMKAVAEFCPKCDGKLLGNNSIVLPFYCRCGKWKWNWETEEFDLDASL